MIPPPLSALLHTETRAGGADPMYDGYPTWSGCGHGMRRGIDLRRRAAAHPRAPCSSISRTNPPRFAKLR
jgi:hypothetical protein